MELFACVLKLSFQKMDEVMMKDVVLSFLPGLSEETLTSLQELGVENKEDLALVQEKDIKKYLLILIQGRKLLNGFKGNYIFDTVPLKS